MKRSLSLFSAEMSSVFDHHLLRKSSVLRKGSAFAFKPISKMQRQFSRRDDYLDGPPVIVNSLPKSGTHLLLQVTRSLPGSMYRGNFIATAPSISLKRRSDETLSRLITNILPRETLGAHIYYSDQAVEAAKALNALHLFIYRDPRDVITSEAFYLAEMNRWHRMHKVFSGLKSQDERLALALSGYDERYPECNARILPYAGWLKPQSGALAIRYEDISGAGQEAEIDRIVTAWQDKGGQTADSSALAAALKRAVAPEKSHTFREGGSGKWKRGLSDEKAREVTRTLQPSLTAFGYQ